MTEATVFENTNTDTPDNEGTKTTTDNSSVEALIAKMEKRLDDKDAFIKQLIAEKRSVEAEKDALTQFTPPSPEAGAAKAAANADPATNTAVDANKLAEMVQQAMEANSQKQRSATNLEEVSTKMTEVFGDKAKAELQKRANALGVSVSFLQEVAAQSPRAFYAQIGLTDQEAVSTPATHGDVNTEALKTTSDASAPAEGTYAWFKAKAGGDAIKMANDPKLQREMMKAALASGGVNFF